MSVSSIISRIVSLVNSSQKSVSDFSRAPEFIGAEIYWVSDKSFPYRRLMAINGSVVVLSEAEWGHWMGTTITGEEVFSRGLVGGVEIVVWNFRNKNIIIPLDRFLSLYMAGPNREFANAICFK